MLSLSTALSCSDGEPFRSDVKMHNAGNIAVNATVSSVECPRITSYTITPFLNAAHSDVLLTSTVESSLGVRPVYRWTATSGSFVSIDHEYTSYNCSDEVNPTISLTVTYGACKDSISIDYLDCGE